MNSRQVSVPPASFVEFKIEDTRQTIAQRFEQQARRYSNRLAVKYHQRALTYDDLNGAANRVAHAILERAGRDRSPIALVCGTALSTIVASLGALKAGKAFAPIDPRLPPATAKQILASLESRIVLTDEKSAERARLLASTTTKEINIDTLESGTPAKNPGVETAPDALAYINFTSGSTGAPKGVMWNHRSELFGIRTKTNALRIVPSDRISLLRANNVGAARDMFLALLNGAALNTLDLDESGLTGLAKWLRAEEVSIFTCVATIFRHAVHGLRRGDRFPAVRLIHIGGEPIFKADVELYKKYFSDDCLFVNRYSISETQAVSYFFMDKNTAIEERIPVGYALDGNEIAILDDCDKPVALRKIGEIAIRSCYLAAGYWRQPELTQAKFLADPNEGRARTYLTGDLGYQASDGCLVHVGRKDFQTKIRGYRVDMAAVETALHEIKSVKQAIVIGRKDAAGGNRLIAYIVFRDSRASSVRELRRHLRVRLPDYMVPGAFVILDRMPVNAAGKVDRRALPEPSEEQADFNARLVAPRTAVEKVLARFWRDTLKINKCALDDDFAELGGDSLKAAQILARVQELFRLAPTLLALAQASSIGELARFVVDHEPAPGHSEKIATRRELIAKLLDEERIQLPAGRAVPALEPAELPLSFSQERLWFLDQLDPGNPAYNIVRALRLKGVLDRQALAYGIDEVVSRHEILRTVFPCIDDRPVQQVLSQFKIDVPLIDLRALSRSQRRVEVSRVLTEESSGRFHLERGPLVKARLIRLGKAEYVLILVAHQMVCDGWSMNLLLREWAILYRSFITGKAPRLPELKIQYRGYAARQREQVAMPAMEAQLAYWRRRLQNSSAGIGLMTDHPRPAVQSFHGSRLPFTVSPTILRRLNTLGRDRRATPFMVLMAAFNALLWRYTSQDDISIGFPVANRSDRDVENLIGLFVNTLVLRTDLSGNPTFDELLGRVREHCRGALAQQDLPFDKMVEKLQRERDLSRNPLFEVAFAYQNYAAAEFPVPGLKVEYLEPESTAAKFDLTLSLTESGSSLKGFIEYSTDLFDGSTIARMARHFITLLRGVVSHPDQPIATLPLLTQAERRRVLFEWNDTGGRHPGQLCIHRLFEAQAKRSPRALAVQHAEKRLTYADLNRRANQLARFLRKRGIGPEQLVGVCLERSLDMVIALLAVLKAGAAYLPLDSKYPRERLAFMLDDARARMLLTHSKFSEQDRLWASSGKARKRKQEVVCLDTGWKSIAKESSKNLASRVSSRNLAYVVYTSGSTGQPKGVAIEHRNAVAFLQWARTVFSRTELSGVLASTSICFDLSIFELFAPLSCGGQIILVEDALTAADLVERKDITLVNMVPSAMSEVLAAGGLPSSVLTVNLAGEPLKPELVQQLYATGTVEKVYDLYGPSETTTYSTFTLRAADSKATIGRPIANTRIYLLDTALQPVPVGVPGEIFIAGAGVARGYLRRPDSTAEKFLPDPFSAKKGARMYRSGDLARFYPDGSIEYLGRADHQVKVRGYRIELGEIEAILAEHAAIRECVVVGRDCVLDSPASDNPKSEKHLVGYFVPYDGTSPAAIELRNFLRQKLPEFMLPSMLIRLDVLPLTPNGKVDRAALAALEADADPAGKDFVAPRSEIEEMIAQVWREVLKIDRVGVFDDFFEMGGHSLLATRVAARLRGFLYAELSLRKLFEVRTVAGLAQEVEALRQDRRGIVLPPITATGGMNQAPLSFAQQRLWFLHKLDPDLTAYNMPAGYRIHGPFEIPLFEHAIEKIIQRHDILRSAIVEIAGEPVQKIMPVDHLPVPVIDLTTLPAEQIEQEVARYANEDAEQPYDLTTAPLMRAKILRLGDEENVVLLNFHHIVCDGSSLVVFYNELAAIYESLAGGMETALPRRCLQYADFSLWQRRAFQQARFQRQAAYWRRQLGGTADLAELPADWPRPAVFSYRGAKVIERLSRELTLTLQQLAGKEQVTLFMILLAALKLLVARLAGQYDVVIGATIAGRSRPELEGLIGFFINALALRTDLSGNLSFSELLKRVREVCLEGFTHQDLPFERVVEEINPERDPTRNPIFQVLFNMADISDRELKLAGCATTRLTRVAPGSKFDLVAHAPQVDGCIELALVYNRDLFTEARVRGMLGQWIHLLSQIVADPARRLDQFSMVPAAAKPVLPNPLARLDDRWQGPIHRWLARRAVEQPNKEAVADERESWNYRELDRLSNRLARRFIADGIKPKDVVAIYAHRDASLALVLLGCLKAGAVFVILDPAYPPARLVDYLRLAQPSGLLHMEEAGSLQAEIESCVDSLEISMRLKLPREKKQVARLLARCADAEPEIDVTADDPAYIAFTSGSTGQPKGVLCRHGPMSYFLHWQEDTFDLHRSDRYGLLSGLGYNHLHRDVFIALALGATLRVPSEHSLRDPERLAEWLQRQEISILHLTPALGRFLQTAENNSLPSVRRIFFGGDLLTSQDVAAMREMALGATMTSFYGATETQRAVGYFIIPDSLSDCRDQARVMPIGRGAPAVQLLLLTQNHQLAGIGEAGELYIRSPHLASGYIDDAELSETRFVMNPFAGDPRDRLFRTGELGRYSPDGNVEWLGRNHRRAGVRGFRVELAEVEATLRQCPGVRHAAVVAQEDISNGRSGGETRLIAYVEPEKRCALDVAAARQFLNGRLPHYMIPAYFNLIDRIPLNPNGKIDYAALPQAKPLRPRAAQTNQAPINDLERAVAEIFVEILQIDRIGRRDSFFELGGHSLTAAKAAARIREELGLRLDLRAFLECPTVEGICRRIETDSANGARLDSAPLDEREEIEL